MDSQARKLIVKGYIEQKGDGSFILYIQSGNSLPIRNSQHDNYLDASKEAERIGCSSYRLVTS